MKVRLALLIIVLCLVLAARAWVDRNVAPFFNTRSEHAAATLKKLSAGDQAKLKDLQARFMEERDKYLKLKNAKAPAAEVQAQYSRVVDAVTAVQALGGTEAVRSLPKSEFAPISRPADSRSGPVPGPAAGK